MRGTVGSTKNGGDEVGVRVFEGVGVDEGDGGQTPAMVLLPGGHQKAHEEGASRMRKTPAIKARVLFCSCSHVRQ